MDRLVCSVFLECGTAARVRVDVSNGVPFLRFLSDPTSEEFDETEEVVSRERRGTPWPWVVVKAIRR